MDAALLKRALLEAALVSVGMGTGIASGVLIPGLATLAPFVFGAVAGGSVLADVIEKPLLSAPQNFPISGVHYNAGEIAGLRLYLRKYQSKAGVLFGFSILLKIALGVCASALYTNLGGKDYLKLIGFAALGALIIIACAQIRLIQAYRRFVLDYTAETEDRIRAETTLSALSKAA